MRGKRISAGIQRIKYVATDWVTANIAFLSFNWFRYFLLNPESSLEGFLHYIDTRTLILEQWVVPICLLFLYWMSGYYNRPFGKSRLQELVSTMATAVVATAILYVALMTNDFVMRRSINWAILILMWACLSIPTYIGRLIVTATAMMRLKRGEWGFNTIIIGNSNRARCTAGRLARSNATLGYKVLGYIPIDGEIPVSDDASLFDFDDLDRMARDHQVDQVIVVPASATDEQTVLPLLYRLFPLGVGIKIEPDTLSFMTASIRLQDIYGEPFVDITSPSISESSKNIKRLGDVLFSAVALVMLSPVMLALAIWIKLDSEGPVFYSQERIGYHGRPFRIFKFRSMRTDAESAGPRLSSDTDSRVTRAGRVLRKFRLDELPQFWNVLRGDMSLVGPRPEREYYIRQILVHAPYYGLVHQVRPGITSWGMVKYGYASTVQEMVRRSRFELVYLSNMSVAVDIKILIHTVKTVITGRGV